MKTAVEWLGSEMQKVVYIAKSNKVKFDDLLEQAKEMELQQQGKFTIDFINWLHLNEYKYNPKAKLYQKQFINETLFFSIDELFITFKSK